MPGDESIGSVLYPKYFVVEKIGTSALASIWMAGDQEERIVVVKVPDPSLLSDAEFRGRFVEKARELVPLRHPHLVRVLDAGHTADVVYAVLEHVGGGSLLERLERDGGRETPEVVLGWLRPIAAALDFVHASGVAHRDVKPANVLFDVKGRPLLSDFTIARALVRGDGGLAVRGRAPGDAGYLAPEVFDGRFDAAADRYALAAVVFRCLTGEAPHPLDTPEDLRRQLAGWLPPPAVAVLARALSADPARRFDSCERFAAELGEACGASPVPGSRAEALAGSAEEVLLAEPVAEDPAGDPPTAPPLTPHRSERTGSPPVAPRPVPPAGPRPARDPPPREPLPPAPPLDEPPTGEIGPLAFPAGPEVREAPLPPRRPPPPAAVEVTAPPSAAVEVAPPSLPRRRRFLRLKLLFAAAALGLIAYAVLRGGSPEPPASSGELLVDRPSRDAFLAREPALTIAGRLIGYPGGRVTAHGLEATPDASGAFELVVPLSEGENDIRIRSVTAGGADGPARTLRVVLDGKPPELRIREPRESTVTSGRTILVAGRVSDDHPGPVTVDGRVAALEPDGTFFATVPLADEGGNRVVVEAEDAAGNRSRTEVVVRRDTTPPEIGIEAPPEAAVTNAAAVAVAGRVRDLSPVTLSVRAAAVPVGSDGLFRATLPLAEGRNDLVFEATDAAGNSSSATRMVHRDTRAPEIRLARPPGTTTEEELRLEGTMDEDGCTVTVNGRPAEVTGRAFAFTLPLAPGVNPVEIAATDRAGNRAAVTAAAIRTAPPVPPTPPEPPPPEPLPPEPAPPEPVPPDPEPDRPGPGRPTPWQPLEPVPPGPDEPPAGPEPPVTPEPPEEEPPGYGYAPPVRAAMAKLVAGGTFREADPPLTEAGYAVFVHERTGLAFVLVPGGEFTMGSRGEEGAVPVRTVRAPPFLLARTECPQAIYEKTGGKGWPQWKGPNLPVENVNFTEVGAWCARNGLRLPSEAEWEYACRAGTTTRYFAGDDPKSLAGFANIADAYLLGHYRELWSGAMPPTCTREVNDGFAGTAPVGRFKPNPFGLHDMHGNVWEWCADAFRKNYEGAPAHAGPNLKGEAGRRVIRGGSWFTPSGMCRSATRAWLAEDSRSRDLGFRPAFSLPL